MLLCPLIDAALVVALLCPCGRAVSRRPCCRLALAFCGALSGGSSLSLDRRSLCSGDRLRSCRCRVFGLSLRRLSVDWLLDRLLLSSFRRSFGRLRDRLFLPLAWLRDRSRFFDRLSFPRSFDSLRERLFRSLDRLFSRRSLDRLRGRLLREERSRCLECARSSRRCVFESSSLYCCRLSGLPVLVCCVWFGGSRIQASPSSSMRTARFAPVLPPRSSIE